MRKKKDYGFTLIEVIAAIIIIGILALVTVPSISRYIIGTKNTTYESYEDTMKNAARNMTIKCIDSNDKNCKLPDQGQKDLIYLNELIENGFIDALKDPNSDNYCSDLLSYVEVENTGNSNYTYQSCLYCGEYKTDESTCTKYIMSGEKPECGEITGSSTKWTNQDRTITVGCTDSTSGCTKDVFSKTFRTTAEKSTVEIMGKNGVSNTCPVDVYVDKDLPTCELEIVGGNLESAGWYSGEVKVRLKSYNDSTSGVLTYGIGTSMDQRNYNKETLLELKNGYTTVMGYVKDYAGNEGICSLNVRVGAKKPEFKVEYGYQIYPNKESYSLTNMTESGTTLTSTSTDPFISFTGLENYRSVNRVVVHFNSGIPTTTTGQVFYSNESHSEANSKKVVMPQGATRIEFEIPTGTYSNIRLDLGNISGKSYNIKKIELMVGNRSTLYTNKNVTINLVPINEAVKTTKFSFDNGATWQTSNSKEYSTNYTGQARVKNELPLTSEPQNISIGNIDKVAPTVSYNLASGSYNTAKTVKVTVTDTNFSYMDVQVNNSSGKVDAKSRNGITTNTFDVVLDSNNKWTIYVRAYDKAGSKQTTAPLNGDGWTYQTYIIDTVKPTLTISASGLTVKLTAADTGGSGLSSSNKYQYCLSTSNSSATECTWTNYTSGTNFTLSGSGTRYLFVYPVKDNSGNVNDGKTFGTPYMIKSFSMCISTFNSSSYTYTGTKQFIDDGSGNWRIKFLTSGTLTFKAPLCDPIDVFLVGGGSAAGGSGYTKTARAIMVNSTTYDIVVGDGGTPSSQNGKDSSAFGHSVSGGSGRNGGSGGGSPGYTGPGSAGAEDGKSAKGTGQGTTTREFGESTGTLYAGGGGGGGGFGGSLPCVGDESAGYFGGGKGGAGGGGKGAGGNPCDRYASPSSCQNGTPNTGGGAGTGIRGSVQCNGGSGIVIIRNIRQSHLDFYIYSGDSEYIDQGNGNWQIRLLTSGKLTMRQGAVVDAFLVGGGGGGVSQAVDNAGGGGGGGGYTKTQKNISLSVNQTYNVTVGAGGKPGNAGGTTTAFGYSAAGGSGASARNGGNGGSGGGGGGYSNDYRAGAGGSNGGNGGSSTSWGNEAGTGVGGAGQGTTTRAFGESGGALYAGGGSGSAGKHWRDGYGPSVAGGAGGGGAGGSNKKGANGTNNTGGGGGGAYSDYAAGSGGSGIVIIRNKR